MVTPPVGGKQKVVLVKMQQLPAGSLCRAGFTFGRSYCGILAKRAARESGLL
jgi:hypothetical protein